MSLAKRLHQLYQDKLLNPLYRRRLNDYLTTLHQNTMNSEENDKIRFGQDTIESLEEKKRKEEIENQH
jgi:hypothetical protein